MRRTPCGAPRHLAACAILVFAAAQAAHAQRAVAGSVRAAADTLASVTSSVATAAWSVGSSRAVIDSAAIASAGALTLSELVEARAPSVSVFQSGGLLTQAGQIRMRGPTSVLAESLPLVVVDGVPMANAEDDTIATASRLDDIPLADVARIEILRGPAAAALYGVGAASGVILVTTIDAGAHPIRWRASEEASTSQVPGGFDTIYQGIGTRTFDGASVTNCGILAIERNVCTQTAIRQRSLWGDAGLLRTGVGFGTAVSASGGSEETHGRLSVVRRDANGVARDDAASSTSARLDLTQRIIGTLEATAHVGFVRGRARPSQNDRVAGDALRFLGSATGADSLRASTDAIVDEPARIGHLDHLATALALQWRPWANVTVRGLASRDRVDERASTARPLGYANYFQYDSLTATNTLRSTRAELEAVHHVASARATLLAGVEHQHESNGSYTATYISNGTGPSASSSTRRWLPKANTNALFGEERLAWGERAAIGGGVRYERADLGGVVWRAYPTVDGTYRIASDWHGADLRLRGAYGEAPQRAGPCSPYAIPPNPSNPFGGGGYTFGCDSTPERSREQEVGIDASFARLSLALTGFRTLVSGVWIPEPTTEYFRRVRLRNQGVELDADALLLDRTAARWRVGIVAATLSDRLLAPNYPLSRLGGYTGGALGDGKPAWGIWPQQYTYADANGDGLIDISEITLIPSGIIGPATPSLESALHSTLAIGHGLSFAMLLDGRHGHYVNDGLYSLECAQTLCRGAVDTTASLGDQAAALIEPGSRISARRGDFWRLRELSARWEMPGRLAARVGARDAAVLVAGRNLATWTSLPTGDPEIDDVPRSAVARMMVAGIPLPRELIVRVELGFGGD